MNKASPKTNSICFARRMGCQPVVRNQGDSDSKADRGGASFIGMGNGDLHHHRMFLTERPTNRLALS